LPREYYWGDLRVWSIERTFAIIKPDAVKRGLAGDILSRIHKAGFQIVAIKSLRLSKAEAEGFYAVHKARPFFGELTDFMSSGKAIVMALEAEGAIASGEKRWRHRSCQGRSGHDPPRMGASIQENCTHGSDAPELPLLKSAISSPAWNCSGAQRRRAGFSHST